MASKSIDIIISTVLKKTGIEAAGAALKSLSARAAAFGKAVGANLMNIKAGFDMAIAAARKFIDVIKLGIEFERMTYGFKSLVGSIDDARKHMADLQELGRTPPFDLEQFASASREMLKLSGGVLGFKDSLKIVGDMAAATGNDIRSVGHAFGLAYQSIRDGEGFGRAGSQLVQLGILTKKQVADFEELTKSGKSNAEVWDEFVKVVNRYEGAMADVEKTTGGVIDAIGGEATVAMTKLGESISNSAAPWLDRLLEYLRELNDSGKIEEWAENVSRSMDGVAISISALAKPVMWLIDLFSGVTKGFRVFYRTALEFVAAAKGALVGGGGLKDAWEQASDAVKQAWHEEFSDDDESESERRANAEIKRIEAEAKKEREEAERTAKIREDLARAEAEKRAQAEYDAELKLREQIESRADFEAELERKKIEEAEKQAAEAIKEREELEKKAAQDMEREMFNKKAENLRKLHDQQMRAFEEEQRKLNEQIAKLKEIGASNPMQMAKTLDQAGMIRNERQAKIDEARFEKARDALNARMTKAGITDINDPEQIKKLGRLSNLDRATLERMRLDKAKDGVNAIEKKKLAAVEKMKANLDTIAAQMTGIAKGL